jgi:cytochrome P450
MLDKTMLRHARFAPGTADDVPLPILPRRLRTLLRLPAALRDPLSFLLAARERHGDFVCVRAAQKPVVLLAHPDYVQHVLQDNHPNYAKGRAYAYLKPVLGETLLTADGEVWRKLRRLVQPAFAPDHSHVLRLRVLEAVESMHLRWEQSSAAPTALTLRDELIEVTLDALLRSMFSSDLGGSAAALRTEFLIADSHIEGASSLNPLKIPGWVPTASNRRFRRAMTKLDGYIYALIAQRRRQCNHANDLLQMLIGAQDPESGVRLTDLQLRDVVMNLMHGGYEPLSDALTWTWWLLGRHPEVAARVEQEVLAGLPAGHWEEDFVKRLPYTQMVCHEALRLYPSSWGFARTAIADDEIAGWRIPARSMVLVSPFVTHRHPQFWPNPEQFDPERFAAQQVQKRHPFAYFPFAAGPRICIGRNFALEEMLLILALTTRRFQITTRADGSIRPMARYGLEPNRPIYIGVSARANYEDRNRAGAAS